MYKMHVVVLCCLLMIFVPGISSATIVSEKNSFLSKDVTCIQHLLFSSGEYMYPMVTGFYGPLTQEAVKMFQTNRGIVTGGSSAGGFGRVGPKTSEALLQHVKSLPPTTVTDGAKKCLDKYSTNLTFGSSNQVLTFAAPAGPASSSRLSITLATSTDELVWRSKGNNCLIPDGPLHMWKNSEGKAVGIISIPNNHTLTSDVVGGEFTIKTDQIPQRVFTSEQRTLQSAYDSKMWMMGFWTDNGKDVYSVAHHEWYPASVYRRHDTMSPSCSFDPPRPSGVSNRDSWMNNIHHLTSTDGGKNFKTTTPYDSSLSSNSQRIAVMTEPYGLKPVSPNGVVRYGFFHPSNIVKEGKYYYFTVGVQEIVESAGVSQVPEREGLMFVRTSDISGSRKTSDYEFWDNGKWTSIKTFLKIGRPYIFTHKAGVENSFKVEDAAVNLFSLSFSLTWNPKHKQWIILGYSRTRELSFLTTPSLEKIDISPLQKVQNSLYTGPQVDGGWFASYPALIDPTSSGLVFQEVNDSPYLYYVNGIPESGVREFRRMKVNIN